MKKLLVTFWTVALIFGAAGATASEVSPEFIDGATTVDTAKAKELFDSGVLFVDVRKDKDWAAGRIPDAVHIELKKAFNEDALSAEVEKDEPVVIYCNGHKCLRSSEAANLAVGWGFSKVYYYRDGFPAWKAAHYPVE